MEMKIKTHPSLVKLAFGLTKRAEKLNETLVTSLEEGTDDVRPFYGLDYPSVQTDDRTVPVTPIAGTEGGKLGLPGGIKIRMGKVVDKTTGTMTTVETVAWFSKALKTDTTYYLRGKVVNDALEVYTTGGKDEDKIPETMMGKVDGVSGGGFDSTQIDILLAKVVTGGPNERAKVTLLSNHTVLKMSAEYNIHVPKSVTKYEELIVSEYNFARTPVVTANPQGFMIECKLVGTIDGGANNSRKRWNQMIGLRATNITRSGSSIEHIWYCYENRSGAVLFNVSAII